MWSLLLTLACLQAAVLADGEGESAKRIHAVSQNKKINGDYQVESRSADTRTTPDVSMCYDKSTIRTCGDIITSNNALFRSPVANLRTWNYPSNMDCSWTIRAPISYVVRFEFLCFFSTEATSTGSTCRYDDYLEMKNMSGATFQYCGSHAIDELDAYETDGNEATLTFHSNSALTAKGFVVRADFVKKYSDMCFDRATIRTCGATILSNNAIFRSAVTSSSNWTYPDDVDCSWTIQAPIGYVVRFKFLCFFSTEATSIGSTCRYDDYLEIKNTSGRTFQYCGTHAIEELDAYETDGNEATLTFHSNSALTAQGFVVRADFVKKYPDTCFDSTTIRSCGSVITTNNTIIRSPIISDSNWRYPISQECSWTVRAPGKIKLEFLCFFDVRNRLGSCGDAHLLVQSKIGRGTKYCGLHRDLEPFETSSNEVTLTFRSNSYTSYSSQGFVIKVSFSSAGLPTFKIALILVGLLASILTSG